MPDPHTPGSPLPPSPYIADQGYFSDGTPMNGAGNALFRPPMPDPHTPGSPLPPSEYIADTGYFSDGTALGQAGNDLFRP